MLRGVTADFAGRTVLARSACLLSVAVPRADRRARVALVGEVARGRPTAEGLAVDASMTALVFSFPSSGLSCSRFKIEVNEDRVLRPGLGVEVDAPRVAGRRA